MATGFSGGDRRWHQVWALFLRDCALVWVAFSLGAWLRFGEIGWHGLIGYAPGVMLGALVLPSILYIAGFYSQSGPDGDGLKRIKWLLGALAAVLIVVLTVGSLNFSSRVGRGVLAYSFGFLVPVIFLIHLRQIRLRAQRWKRVLCLVTSPEDEAAANLLNHFWGESSQILGLVTGAEGYQPRSALPIEGSIDKDGKAGFPDKVDLILVRDQHISNPLYGPVLRRIRYDGVEIVSLADVCEDAYHALPLGLITENWLFRASNQPGVFYIRKMKRLFDVLAASFFLVVLAPFLLLGIILVKLNSPGPVFFRQKRAGRLERPITIVKLRTMHPLSKEGEAKGKWATDEASRIFPAGSFLRQFRIDEIPQLWNILKGDMSFVGPRPEQISMIEELNETIPFYRERLLIQPGLTGWAQVKFPYGGTIEDAARKLEYDLYYLKHMSLFLDFFVLLETVKIILQGGVRKGGDQGYLEFRKNLARGPQDADTSSDVGSASSARSV